MNQKVQGRVVPHDRRSIHDAVVLTGVPSKIRQANPFRAGLTLQNNHATANMYYRSGGNGVDESYLKLAPGTGIDRELWAPTQELWAYSDVDDVALTIVENFGD